MYHPPPVGTGWYVLSAPDSEFFFIQTIQNHGAIITFIFAIAFENEHL